MRRRDVAAVETPSYSSGKREYHNERPHINSTQPDMPRFRLATGDVAPGRSTARTRDPPQRTRGGW
jgi:hypothetical protein